MPRRVVADVFMVIRICASLAPPVFVEAAPVTISASPGGIGRIDRADLAGAFGSAALELPSEIRITLVAEGESSARAIPDRIAALAWGDRDIVIFPGRVLSYPYDSLESVVRHEVTHLALDARAGGAPLPLWFHEGVATSVDSGWKTAARFQLLLAMLARPDTAELTRLFISPVGAGHETGVSAVGSPGS